MSGSRTDSSLSEQYAYNRSNPRWEAPYHNSPPEGVRKPYKPLRQPPEDMPAHRKRGRHDSLVFSSAVTATLAGTLVLAVAAEWLAGTLGAPTGGVAVALGLAVGPVAGWLDPAALFGSLLLPGIGLCIAVILFESGLHLNAVSAGMVRSTALRLVTVGALATGLIGTLAAALIAGLSLPLAALFGALCSFTGTSLNDAIRKPAGESEPLHDQLRLESLALELTGSVAAVLVFEAVVTAAHRRGIGPAVMTMATTLWVGGLAGVLGASGLVAAIRYQLIPAHLQRAIAYVGAIGLFAGADYLHSDAGIVAAATMGVALSSQTFVQLPVTVVAGDSTALVRSALCIVLAALLGAGDAVADVSLDAVGLLVAVLLVARPIGVLLATAWSALSWRERFSLSFWVPRGVVPIGLAAIFAIRLTEMPAAAATRFVPLALLVLLGAALVSNFGTWLAMRLHVATLPGDEIVRLPGSRISSRWG